MPTPGARFWISDARPGHPRSTHLHQELPAWQGLKADGAIYTVFSGLPKSALCYSGRWHERKNSPRLNHRAGRRRRAAHDPKPSHFLPRRRTGTGYSCHRLTDRGGPGASLTKKTISTSFSKPARQVNQPGTTADTLDPSDGNITHSPYFDGRFIWFARWWRRTWLSYRAIRAPEHRRQQLRRLGPSTGQRQRLQSLSRSGDHSAGRDRVYSTRWFRTPYRAGDLAVFASGDASEPIVTIAGAGTIYSPSPVMVTGCGKCKSVTFPRCPWIRVSRIAFATRQYFGTDGN